MLSDNKLLWDNNQLVYQKEREAALREQKESYNISKRLEKLRREVRAGGLAQSQFLGNLEIQRRLVNFTSCQYVAEFVMQVTKYFYACEMNEQEMKRALAKVIVSSLREYWDKTTDPQDSVYSYT